MNARLRDIPGAVLCLAMALSRGERREALQIAQFVRGLAIQISLRAATGECMVAGSNATLLYSRLDKPRTHPARTAVAMLTATVVGVTFFFVSNSLLIVPVVLLLHAAGATADAVEDVILVITAGRLGWTASRAVKTYALERRRQAFLGRVSNQPRWRLDLMGATPPGRGHGTALLKEFVARSDAAGATVYLVTEPRNRAFYRRNGFHAVNTDESAFRGMVLMRRVAPGARIPQQRIRTAVHAASR